MLPVESIGLKLNMIFHIDLWSKSRDELNDLTEQIMEIMLKEESSFSDLNLLLKPSKGFDMDPELLPPDVFGRTIECLVEGTLQVEMEYPPIKKIEIKRL